MLLLLYTLFLTSVMSAVVDYDVWDPVIRVELENNHRRQEPFKILKYVRENKAEVEKEMKEHHIGRIGHRFPMENFMPLRGRSFMTSATLGGGGVNQNYTLDERKNEVNGSNNEINQ